MGLLNSVFAKLSKKNAEDAIETKKLWTDTQEQVERWNICVWYGKEKTPEATNRIFEAISERNDRCAVVLMDYYQKEQVKASENMSWIYDVHYEMIKHARQILAVGKRCYDYKIRCLLAGIEEACVDTVLTPETVVKELRLSEVDTICFVVSPSNAMLVEGIKDELIKAMKKEAGIK